MFVKYTLTVEAPRGGGLVVSALDSGVSAPGSSPGRGYCVVFLGNNFTITVPLSTQVYEWVPAKEMALKLLY